MVRLKAGSTCRHSCCCAPMGAGVCAVVRAGPATRRRRQMSSFTRAVCICLYPSVHPSTGSGRTEKTLTLGKNPFVLSLSKRDILRLLLLPFPHKGFNIVHDELRADEALSVDVSNVVDLVQKKDLKHVVKAPTPDTVLVGDLGYGLIKIL